MSTVRLNSGFEIGPNQPTETWLIQLGTLWMDTSTGVLKKCTSLSPITFTACESGAYAPTPFLSGTTTLTAQPLADTELPATQYRLLLDMSKYTQFRVTMRVATAGSSGAGLRFQFATTDAGTYANLDGSLGPETIIGTVGEKDTGWVNLVAGAKVDNCRLRMMGKNGNGTLSPVIRQVFLQFK